MMKSVQKNVRTPRQVYKYVGLFWWGGPEGAHLPIVPKILFVEEARGALKNEQVLVYV